MSRARFARARATGTAHLSLSLSCLPAYLSVGCAQQRRRQRRRPTVSTMIIHCKLTSRLDSLTSFLAHIFQNCVARLVPFILTSFCCSGASKQATSEQRRAANCRSYQLFCSRIKSSRHPLKALQHRIVKAREPTAD